MTMDTEQSKVLRWWRRALITITACSAAAASFVFLRELGLHVGWPGWAAILVPLSIDALAAAALTEYRLTGSRSAGLVAVLVIIASAAGNALSHMYSTGIWEPEPVAVIAVGAVPAVALGLVVHTATKGASTWNASSSSSSETAGGSRSAGGQVTSTSDHQTQTSRRSAGAPAADSSPPGGNASTPAGSPPSPKPAPGRKSNRPPAKTGGSPKRTDTELVSQIVANGWTDESLNTLASQLSVSKRRASTLKEMARNQANPAPQPGQLSAPEPVPNGQPSKPGPVPETSHNTSAAPLETAA